MKSTHTHVKDAAAIMSKMAHALSRIEAFDGTGNPEAILANVRQIFWVTDELEDSLKPLRERLEQKISKKQKEQAL